MRLMHLRRCLPVMQRQEVLLFILLAMNLTLLLLLLLPTTRRPCGLHRCKRCVRFLASWPKQRGQMPCCIHTSWQCTCNEMDMSLWPLKQDQKVAHTHMVGDKHMAHACWRYVCLSMPLNSYA